MRPEEPLVSSWLFWGLLWLAVTALVPEVSEIATLGRPELAYRSHNFQLSWGLQHIPAAVLGLLAGGVLMKRAPIVSVIAIVVLALEIAFAVLDYRRNSFVGNGEGRISPLGYVFSMVGAGAVFAFAWLYFRRRDASERRDRGRET